MVVRLWTLAPTFFSGRPYGGTAILCRQNLAACVKLIDSKNSRITAIEINVSINNLSSSILLASVYMPVDPGSNSDEDFEFVCGCLNALITDSHVSGYIFAGDFNFRPNSTRLDFIVDCLAPHCAVMADLCILEANNFTYISDVHSTTSWIDHIIVNHSLLCKISCMSIDHDSVASDHRPLSFKFDAETSIGPTATNDVSDADITYISNWEACSMANRSSYSAGLDELLQSVHMPSLCCIDKCTDSSHKKDIDQYLESICGCINEAMHRHIPCRKVKASEYAVAGWNDLVSDKHDAARQAF